MRVNTVSIGKPVTPTLQQGDLKPGDMFHYVNQAGLFMKLKRKEIYSETNADFAKCPMEAIVSLDDGILYVANPALPVIKVQNMVTIAPGVHPK